MLALSKASPDAKDDELITAFRRFEAETLEMLLVPDTWEQVIRIANALLAKDTRHR